jgi:hypothetical protein
MEAHAKGYSVRQEKREKAEEFRDGEIIAVVVYTRDDDAFSLLTDGEREMGEETVQPVENGRRRNAKKKKRRG